jgi:hypothetical protein
MDKNDCILYPNQYNFLYITSYFALFTSLYAFYNGYYDFAFINIFIFITSINYWRKPDYSWRRYVDIFAVNIAFLYYIIRAYKSQNYLLYYGLFFICVICYIIGILYHKKKCTGILHIHIV